MTVAGCRHASRGSATREPREPEQDSAYRPTPESPVYRRLSDLRSYRACQTCGHTVGCTPEVRAQKSQITGRRRIVNKNKYLIGLIGLAVGFIVSFFLTQNYNKSNAAPAAAGSPSGM